MSVNLCNDSDEKKFKVNKNNLDLEKCEKVYNLEEALELAGNGWYTLSLLITMSVALQALSLDMFGFSVVVTGVSCDFQLNQTQKTVLLSVPFVGPILMAYPWGYLADTRGRRFTMMIGLWGSFIANVVGALSPNWEMLAVCKLIATIFSSCIQSVCYALMGESCGARVRSAYILFISTVLMYTIVIDMGLGYLILNMSFSYNLLIINFTPWRLLALVLGLPLGISGIFLFFFYESPKFLANSGNGEEALQVLIKIWRRNGCKNNVYPVKRLQLGEETASRMQVSTLQSLLDQLVPLFYPPLLWRTLQLFYIASAIYLVDSSMYMWFPFLTKELSAAMVNSTYKSHDNGLMCDVISGWQNQAAHEVNCASPVDLEMLIISALDSVIFTCLSLVFCRLASRKKIVLMMLLFFSGVSVVGVILMKEPLISLVLFLGIQLESLGMGIIFAFVVEVYPTSYRGMAVCLCVMVARGAGWLGVNLLGIVMVTYCHQTFYFLTAHLMSAAVLSYWLPPSKSTKDSM